MAENILEGWLKIFRKIGKIESFDFLRFSDYNDSVSISMVQVIYRKERTMKRLYPFVLLALCVILTGCGKNRALEGVESFSEKLNSTENLKFTAELRTEYDDKTVSFLPLRPMPAVAPLPS